MSNKILGKRRLQQLAKAEGRLFEQTGGDDVGDAVRKNIRKLMNDTVAKGVSLKGQKGNYGFKNTSSCRVLTEAILGMKKFKFTETDIDSAFARWLDHAGDRLKKLDKTTQPRI